MASVDAHLAQYRHNRLLLPVLPRTHHDWMVTVTFYCCVQLIDAVLAAADYHPVDHKTRNNALANSNRLQFIAKTYDPLYQLCRKVRYMADPLGWIPFSEVDARIIRGHLYPIEKSAFRLLRRDEVLPEIELDRS